MLKKRVVVEIKDTSNADIRKTHSFVRDSDKVPASYGLYQMFSSLIFSPQQNFRVLVIDRNFETGKEDVREAEYIHFVPNIYVRTSRFGMVSVLLKRDSGEEDRMLKGIQKRREKFLKRILENPITTENIKENKDLYKEYSRMLEDKLTTAKVSATDNPGLFHALSESMIIGDLAEFVNQKHKEAPLEQKIEILQDLMFRTAFGRTLFLTPEQKQEFSKQFLYDGQSLPKITLPGFVSLSLQFVSSLAEKLKLFRVPRFHFTFKDENVDSSNTVPEVFLSNRYLTEILSTLFGINEVAIESFEQQKPIDKKKLKDSIKDSFPRLSAFQGFNLEQFSEEASSYIENYLNAQLNKMKQKYPNARDLKKQNEFGEILEESIQIFFEQMIRNLEKSGNCSVKEGKGSFLCDFGNQVLILEKKGGKTLRGIGDIRFFVFDKKEKTITPILLEVKSTTLPRIQNFLSVYEIFVALRGSRRELEDAGINIPQRMPVNNPKLFTINFMKNRRRKNVIFEFPSELDAKGEQYETIREESGYKVVRYKYGRLFHYSMYGSSLYIPEKEFEDL